MHLDVTPEALLAQLSYPKSEAELDKMNKIIANTEGFDHFSQHLFSLHDALAVEKGFVAMSNSEDYLKIKCDEDKSAHNLEAFTDLVTHWADKYKVTLKKVDQKNTYYILGQK